MGFLRFTVELVSCRQWHEEVDDEEVVVDGIDLSAIADPEEASAENGELLVGGNEFCGTLHLTQIREGDCPFESGRPEEDGHDAGRVRD